MLGPVHFLPLFDEAKETGNDDPHDRCMDSLLHRFAKFDVTVSDGVLEVLWDAGQDACRTKKENQEAKTQDGKSGGKSDKPDKDAPKDKEKKKKDKKRDDDDEDQPKKKKKKA